MSKTEGIVITKKRRFRYTHLEERKIWHFFLRELKARNPDALGKRIVLWEMYEKEEKTTKKMYGLESHFRKYMLPRINRAAVPKQDLFLLLRFFHAQLNTSQRKELEHDHGCEIECEMDGTFLRARIEDDNGTIFYPTAEQENTILRTLDEEQTENEENDNHSNEARADAETESVVADSVFGDEHLDEEEQENKRDVNGVASTNHSGGWVSKSALLNRPAPRRVRKRKHDNRDTTPMSENATPLATSTPLLAGQGIEGQKELIDNNRLSSALPLISPSNANNVATTRSLKLKQHFLDGSVKFLEGQMDMQTLIRPFVGGKFEEGVRAISWLSEKPRDEPESE